MQKFFDQRLAELESQMREKLEKQLEMVADLNKNNSTQLDTIE